MVVDNQRVAAGPAQKTRMPGLQKIQRAAAGPGLRCPPCKTPPFFT
jgi:hypothetical protein